MAIELHTALGGVEGVERVLASVDSPFYRPSWLAAYEGAALSGARVVYAVRVGDRGVDGVLPVYCEPANDPLGIVDTAAGRVGVSHGWHCYDTRLPCTGDPGRFLAEAAAALAAELDTLWLCNVAAETADEALVTAPAPDAVLDMSPRFRLDASRHDGFDSYLACLSRNLRRDLTRHRRRAERAGLDVQVLPLPDSDIKGLAAVAAGLAQRHGTAWYYDADRFARMLAGLDDPDRYLAVELRLEGDLVGGSVMMSEGDTLHLWAGGAARHVEGLDFSPGTVLFDAELAYALGRGVRWVEGGRSNGEYKVRFGFEEVGLKGLRWDLARLR